MHVICTVFRIGNNDSYFSMETTECHFVDVRALWYFEHDVHNSSGQEIHQYNPCTTLHMRLHGSHLPLSIFFYKYIK
jgi:hypothetical protein